jgi:hypothetical protein
MSARRQRYAKADATEKRTISSSCGKRTKKACGLNANCGWNKRVGCVAKKGTRGLMMLNLD